MTEYRKELVGGEERLVRVEEADLRSQLQVLRASRDGAQALVDAHTRLRDQYDSEIAALLDADPDGVAALEAEAVALSQPEPIQP